MVVKDLSDAELQEELDRATDHLVKSEATYVQDQNLCSLLEDELARRNLARVRLIPRSNLEVLVDKWAVKANDIQKASNAFQGDPKSQHALMMQHELLRGCIMDLKDLLNR
jgi:hypothetical protein